MYEKVFSKSVSFLKENPFLCGIVFSYLFAENCELQLPRSGEGRPVLCWRRRSIHHVCSHSPHLWCLPSWRTHHPLWSHGPQDVLHPAWCGRRHHQWWQSSNITVRWILFWRYKNKLNNQGNDFLLIFSCILKGKCYDAIEYHWCFVLFLFFGFFCRNLPSYEV